MSLAETVCTERTERNKASMIDDDAAIVLKVAEDIIMKDQPVAGGPNDKYISLWIQQPDALNHDQFLEALTQMYQNCVVMSLKSVAAQWEQCVLKAQRKNLEGQRQ